VITLEWDGAGRAEWHGLLGETRSGLQQGWSYGEALRRTGVPVHRAVVRDAAQRPVGCLQVAQRALLGPIGAGFLLRGPVWLDHGAAAAHEHELLSAVRRRVRRRMLVWAPELPSALTRRAIVSGYGTAWLDLDRGLDAVRAHLAPDWRRDLSRGEAAGLAVRRLAAPQAIGWLLDQNEAHRRQVGYRGPSRRFLGLLAEAGREAHELILLLAFERAEPVAGIMILRHGASATYEVGYVAPRGRALRAGHLCLWHGVEALVRKRVRWLDLGGVATDRAPGVARFKLGMGGRVEILPGTFLIAG
jgi:hypothetical protein